MLMSYEFAIKCGHDHEGARSLSEGYCVKCRITLPDDKGAITNDGNECDECLDYPY